MWDGAGLTRLQLYGQDGKLLYAGPTASAKTKYIYLNNHAIAEVGGAGTQYLHTDGLGSPVARTSATRALISRTRYEPYGRTAMGAQATIGFTGHVNDIDTGLTYMQQRYYDPVAGRMMSIDPVTTDAGTGSDFDRYAYANNNPYKFVDPDGRQFTLSACVAGPIGCAIGVGLAAVTTYYGLKAVNDTRTLLQNRAEPLKDDSASTPESDGKSGTSNEGAKDGEKSSSKDGAKDPAKPSREKDVPNRGEPGEVKEGERRTREYGTDGKPLRDYDKPHQGYDRPHVHEWPGGVREHPGRDYSPWPQR